MPVSLRNTVLLSNNAISLQALFAVDGTGGATLRTCKKECNKYELIAAQYFSLARNNGQCSKTNSTCA